MLCPYALELLAHGSTPTGQPPYPTAEGSRSLHSTLASIVDESIRAIGVDIVASITVGDSRLCAASKADLVYLVKYRDTLNILYIEATSRINPAKPWQALLRSIALYYQWRTPVWTIIVSPERLLYKILEPSDQDKILRRTAMRAGDFNPTPNICSLCELANYCPYKVI